MTKAVALALVFSAVAGQGLAQTATRFDLVCVGTTDSGLAGSTRSAPFNLHLRVDLTAKRFCSDACSNVESIASVDQDLIILRRSSSTDVLNRRTGTYSSIGGLISAGMVIESRATCTREAFSGFTAASAVRAF